MKYVIKILAKFLLFCFLTVTTQIGGIVLFLTELISYFWKVNFKYKKPILFVTLYLISCYIVVPRIAFEFGREPIKRSNYIVPTFFLTDLLNRNYVRPELNRLLRSIEKDLKPQGIKIKYLDANFPFINGFPLLPHLSHDDGKKIDLSLVYIDTNQKLTNSKKSISGYGVYEEPNREEYNQIDRCKIQGYWQYDFPKYLTLGRINNHLRYSNQHTEKLIYSILQNKHVEKIFIEPHLKNRLNIKDKRIRYHGCKAVRHDDHIHIQIK